MEFENTASRPNSSPSGEFDVYINNEKAITSEPAMNTLEAGETARKSFDLIIDYEGVGSAIVTAIENQSFQIRIEALIRFGDAEVRLEDSSGYP